VQIFNNLVSNAIKYTPPEGTVRVWAEQRDNTLRIAVQDNGMGISPQDQARIFDRFFRVRNAENESIEGTGLGLAIVKKLVDAHKGQIGLESRLGQGSTFFVTLPILPV
jgi:two-component system phosphate regulon sensor histidine kinase PhoR